MSIAPDGATDAAGRLTHLDEHGRARMVDVTGKPHTARLAVARCAVVTTVDAAAAFRDAPDGMDPIDAVRPGTRSRRGGEASD